MQALTFFVLLDVSTVTCIEQKKKSVDIQFSIYKIGQIFPKTNIFNQKGS